jgi:hypothetical protein
MLHGLRHHHRLSGPRGPSGLHRGGMGAASGRESIVRPRYRGGGHLGGIGGRRHRTCLEPVTDAMDLGRARPCLPRPSVRSVREHVLRDARRLWSEGASCGSRRSESSGSEVHANLSSHTSPMRRRSYPRGCGWRTPSSVRRTSSASWCDSPTGTPTNSSPGCRSSAALCSSTRCRAWSSTPSASSTTRSSTSAWPCFWTAVPHATCARRTARYCIREGASHRAARQPLRGNARPTPVPWLGRSCPVRLVAGPRQHRPRVRRVEGRASSPAARSSRADGGAGGRRSTGDRSASVRRSPP